MDQCVARVRVLDAPYHIDEFYEYRIPEELRSPISIGAFAVVPFGPSNRRHIAVVYELSSKSEYNFQRLKPVLSLTPDGVTLTEEQLGLSLFISEHCFCSAGDAIRAILPSHAFSKLVTTYVLRESCVPIDVLSEPAQKLMELFRLHKSLTRTEISSVIGNYTDPVINELLGLKCIYTDFILHENTNKKYITYYHLSDTAAPYLSGERKTRSKKQLDILKYVFTNVCVSEKDICTNVGATPDRIKTLKKNGLLIAEKVDVYRNPYSAKDNSGQNFTLSSEQQSAADTLKELYNDSSPQAALLYGVTGSGKTRVIKDLTDTVLKDGRQVIILVPEIALTPQTVDLFYSYYGNNIAVLHSSLSEGEKFDAWRQISAGLVDICIGTRSAVFAPFTNLGLIVIDEEQEHTYKSDMTPRYSAIDIARYRCAKNNAMMLLSSATPSLTSMYKAKSGSYSLVTLSERYGNGELPQTELYDVKNDYRNGNISPISSKLRESISRVLERGEQAIVFLNRRGFNTRIICPTCGEAIVCPHCSVSLTYHTNSHSDDGLLCCHWCGYTQRRPLKCPSCGNPTMKFMGYGTQYVEQELSALFPNARIMRMDADTTQTKSAYDTMIEDFRDHKADILIGTQMVTKGHNFPNVTLSAVISADMSLFVDDYRATERTFSQITQLVGRSGRVSSDGRAIIQTFSPENLTLRLAASQDYMEYYNNEIPLRRSLIFPPFCDIFLVALSSRQEPDLLRASVLFSEKLNTARSTVYTDVPLIIFGPFEAPVYKVNDRYRMRFIIKCKSNLRSRSLFKSLLCEFGRRAGKYVNVSIDVNPNSL